MDIKTYGGVTAKDIIVFQTKIMMGAQFGRIVWAREHKKEDLANRQDEILIACLRMGWNDAFRHTSANEVGINDTKDSKGKVTTYEKKNKYKKPWLKLSRKKEIKEETVSSDFDDYFSDQVISTEAFLKLFKEYAVTACDKGKVIDSNWKNIENCFRGVKKLSGDKALSLGHIQKMFNIAIKLYLCLYICREELDLDKAIFINDIIDNYDNADCPIDSIILSELEQLELQSAGKGTKYSSAYGSYTWSKLKLDDYREIQKKINSKCSGKSNLWFDFNNWN